MCFIKEGRVDVYRGCTFKGGGASEKRLDVVFGVIQVYRASGVQDDGPIILLVGWWANNVHLNDCGVEAEFKSDLTS